MMDINIFSAFNGMIITDVVLFVKQRIFLFVNLQNKAWFQALRRKKERSDLFL